MQVVHISMRIVDHSILSIDESRLGQDIGSCANGKTDTTKIFKSAVLLNAQSSRVTIDATDVEGFHRSHIR